MYFCKVLALFFWLTLPQRPAAEKYEGNQIINGIVFLVSIAGFSETPAYFHFSDAGFNGVRNFIQFSDAVFFFFWANYLIDIK